MLAVFIERDDLHRDVTRERVLLELAEHGPAQHVRQEHVERHCCRQVLLGEIERIGPARRDQHLEALLTREIHHDPRIVRIVLDDEQDGIAGLDLESIVGNLFDDTLGRCDGDSGKVLRDRGGQNRLR